VLLKNIRHKRAKKLGLKVELSDALKEAITEMLSDPNKKASDFEFLNALGITLDNL